MDFINRLSEKVSKGTRLISEKTDEIIELAELKIEISNLEKEIEEAKLIIGELVYKHYISNQLSIGDLQGKCREIQRMYQKLEHFKKQREGLKGSGYCSFCEEPMEYGEKYCSNCGKKINRY